MMIGPKGRVQVPQTRRIVSAIRRGRASIIKAPDCFEREAHAAPNLVMAVVVRYLL